MLSIIICSINPEQTNRLHQNIEQTVGVEFEVITIDNRQTNYGLCKAYNQGAAKAQYDYLCFVHEDILFHTGDWGRSLIAHLQQPEIGLVGIAGGTLLTKTPATWWNNFHPKVINMNLLQHHKNGEVKHDKKTVANTTHSQVVALDGVFLACRKEVWLEFPFDEKTFTGFHFYDVDFSFQIAQKYKVKVIYDVLIEHFSMGNANKHWLENMLLFNLKWSQKLPYHCVDYTQSEIKTIEQANREILIRNFFVFKIKKLVLLKYIFIHILKSNSTLRALKFIAKTIYDNLRNRI